MIISLGILLKMRIFFSHRCRENRNSHFMYNIFLSENWVVYEMWCENIVHLDRPQIAI